MPLLDRQRRGVVLGSIRIGTKVIGQNGRERPSRLDTFRLTSPDRIKVDAAAHLYGGEVRPWNPGDGRGQQFEVVTSVDRIPVRVPPGEPVTQDYELWAGRPVVRKRLCDGFTERMANRSCLCPADLAERKRMAADGGACRPTTRISLILADLPGLGVWTLTSRGDSAADELGNTAEMLRRAELAGMYLPAALRLEQREARGSGEVHRYAVPVLDVGASLAALESGQIPQPVLASPPTRPALAAAVVEADVEPPVEQAPAEATPPPIGAPKNAQAVADLAAESTDPEVVRRLGGLARERGWLADYVRDPADPSGVLDALEGILLGHLARTERQ